MAAETVRFGISLMPATEHLDRIRALVRTADEAGLDLVGIQDHPYQRRFFDTWSLIPTLLAETQRISFFTDVANLALRPPAVMAKAAASLDVLTGSVQTADGPPRRSEGRRLAAVARGPLPRRAARRQRADRRGGREGGPRPGLDPADPQPPGLDRRPARAVLVKPGHQETWVDYHNDDRAPLLFISGEKDHLMPPSVQRSNAKHYKSDTITEVVEFEGRAHLMPAQDGWQEIADHALEWAIANARQASRA